MTTLDCSIIIVNWNVCALLRRCLLSLPGAAGASLRYEVVVVDNASHDDSVAMVRAEFPGVRVLANATNRGFSGGNNDGIRRAQGRTLLLLNPDTEMQPGTLAVLLATLDAAPDVGMVGPRLLNPDGTIQSSRRRFPTLATALLESTPLQPYLPNHPLLRRYYLADQPDDQAQDVDWITGACMLVRRDVIRQVGGFDEGYFMYSEELDLCRRITAAGWRIVYQPAAGVVHHESQSADQNVSVRHLRFNRSKVRYVLRWHGRTAAAGLRLWLLALYAWQGSLEAVKWLLGHKRPLRAARLRMIGGVLRDGLRLGENVKRET